MFVVIAVALAFVLVYMISDPGSFLFIPLGIQKFEEVRTGFEELFEAVKTTFPITIHLFAKINEAIDRLEYMFGVAIKRSNAEALMGDLIVAGVLESDACCAELLNKICRGSQLSQ